jgi:hypothetical protein
VVWGRPPDKLNVILGSLSGVPEARCDNVPYSVQEGRTQNDSDTEVTETRHLYGSVGFSNRSGGSEGASHVHVRTRTSQLGISSASSSS